MLKIVQLSIISILLISCGRTPSKERFEQATKISIPKEVKVVQDEYQDMMQDYGIEYSILLTSDQLVEVIASIRNSEFYNSNIIGNELIRDEYFFNKAANDVWFRTQSGYRFANRNNRTGIAVKLDTTTLRMEFSEWFD